MSGAPLPADARPSDTTPIHTAELPDTPTRDRNIPATAWVEAPVGLIELGVDLPDRPVANFRRRIGRWLLWRAGPANHADARYWAGDAEDLDQVWTFRLYPDGAGEGTGPSGVRHARFRAWKVDLRDHGEGGPA